MEGFNHPQASQQGRECSSCACVAVLFVQVTGSATETAAANTFVPSPLPCQCTAGAARGEVWRTLKQRAGQISQKLSQ
eukprot:11270-Heterococcus_DN1.PRE.2